TKWPAPRTCISARRTWCRHRPRAAECAAGAIRNQRESGISEFVRAGRVGGPPFSLSPCFPPFHFLTLPSCLPALPPSRLACQLTLDCLLCQHLNPMSSADVSALGEFEQVVLLSILRLGDDAYAVSVRDEILRCTGRDVSRGSIYITLDRLETKGYLRSRLADPTPERGGRAKRYYALRPRAVEALRDSRRALVALWRGLEAVLGHA